MGIRTDAGILVMSLTVMSASPALAQPAIQWSTIDAGGGRSVGPAGYVLEGTIGQFDVGVSTSGALQGQWGFWPGVPITGCRSDIDGNGTVNSTDVSEFINAWFIDLAEGTLVTDFDGNGTVNSTDVSVFINVWFEEFGECGN